MWIFVAAVIVISSFFLFWKKRPVQIETSPLKPAAHGTPLSSEACSLQQRLGLNNTNKPVTIAVCKFYLVHLSELAKVANRIRVFSTLYLLCEAANDDDECAIKNAVSLAFDSFPQHHILFHQCEVGKTAIVRQLAPSLHVDGDFSFCEKLRPHLRCIVHCDGMSLNSCDGTSTPAARDRAAESGERRGVGVLRIHHLTELLEVQLSEN